MKLYAPKYYKNFKCIADKCEHSCCVGWEIDIDSATLQKYEELENGYASLIKDSISREDTPHFKLSLHDRCPPLDADGLCRIISEFGEDYLCDICREHPRFYNYTNVAEVGIGMSCEEAARIILSSADYASQEEIGEVDADTEDLCFDGREERREVYGILQNDSLPYKVRLDKIKEKYCVNEGVDGEWLSLLESLEYLDNSHKELFMTYSSQLCPKDKDGYLERFLAYFIYRHCTEALDTEDFCSRLSFCLFCERLFASLICNKKAETLKEIANLASIISEEIEYSEDNTLTLMN